MVPRDHRADEERARQRCSRQVLVQWQSLDTAELISFQIRRGLAPAGGLNARLTGATRNSKLAWEAGASQLTLTQAAPAPEKGREGEERH
jgi:hypothetical protein